MNDFTSQPIDTIMIYNSINTIQRIKQKIISRGKKIVLDQKFLSRCMWSFEYDDYVPCRDVAFSQEVALPKVVS